MVHPSGFLRDIFDLSHQLYFTWRVYQVTIPLTKWSVINKKERILYEMV